MHTWVDYGHDIRQYITLYILTAPNLLQKAIFSVQSGIHPESRGTNLILHTTSGYFCILAICWNFWSQKVAPKKNSPYSITISGGVTIVVTFSLCFLLHSKVPLTRPSSRGQWNSCVQILSPIQELVLWVEELPMGYLSVPHGTLTTR